MKKLIAANHDKKTLTVDYIAEDGSHLLRSGGTIAWRFNNPGNLRPPGKKPNWEKWSIGVGDTSNGKFMIFPSYEIGRAAKFELLRNSYNEFTISEMMGKYAPKSENNTDGYINHIIKRTGLPSNQALKKFSDLEINKIMDAMQEKEGFHHYQETRHEKWVNTTSIIISDGKKPLPNQDIQIKIGDQVLTGKTNSQGSTPPIAHTKTGEKVEIHLKNLKNQWQMIHSYQTGLKSKKFVLYKSKEVFSGITATETKSRSNLKSFIYIVQPSDTLNEIAKKFRTTVQKVQTGNPEIKNINVIYPGQKILIHGENKNSTQKKLQAVLEENEKPSDSKAVAAANTIPATSKEGAGKPLALIDVNQGRAPWMEVAISEAKKWAGKDETQITETSNYHELINDGIKTLVGKNNAWCAAFINYCLKTKGYSTWKIPMRARAIKDDSNFIKIDEPIYGAIALIGTHHVTFVYCKDKNSKHMICLGGNQSDRITFVAYKEPTTYYVPASYFSNVKNEIEFFKKMNESNELDLNKLIDPNYNFKSKKTTT